MFVDEVTVQLKAGDGGDGCMSFRRAKYEPNGGPNGGNGGKGGDMVLLGDENTADLTDYKFVPHARAENGENGRGSDQHGAGGKDKVLRIPLGTIVIDEETGEPIGELTEHGQRLVLLKGGRGGVGNRVFKSSVNQAPRQTTAGKKGGEGRYRLVLKTIADLGLVGFPNAGKSSLTGLITAKKPKVGHYAFTTLEPHVGVINFPEHYQRLTLADIPGLIKGAHENRGLGHRFLRHIERCRQLLFLLDMAGEDGRDPLDDFKQLLEELGHYDPTLLDKPRLVLGNKIDEPVAVENIKRFKKRFRKEKLIPISCLSEEGIAELKELLRSELAALPRVAAPQFPVRTFEQDLDEEEAIEDVEAIDSIDAIEADSGDSGDFGTTEDASSEEDTAPEKPAAKPATKRAPAKSRTAKTATKTAKPSKAAKTGTGSSSTGTASSSKTGKGRKA